MALVSLHADERVALCVGQRTVNLRLEKPDVPRDRVQETAELRLSLPKPPLEIRALVELRFEGARSLLKKGDFREPLTAVRPDITLRRNYPRMLTADS